MSLWYDVNMIEHLVCGWDVFQNSVHCSIIESKYPTWTEVQFRTSYVNFGVNFLSYIESVQDFSVDPLAKSHLDWRRWKISWKSDFSMLECYLYGCRGLFCQQIFLDSSPSLPASLSPPSRYKLGPVRSQCATQSQLAGLKDGRRVKLQSNYQRFDVLS